MSVYIDLRDWWVGYYRGDTHHTADQWATAAPPGVSVTPNYGNGSGPQADHVTPNHTVTMPPAGATPNNPTEEGNVNDRPYPDPDLDPGFDVGYQPVHPVDPPEVHQDEGDVYDDEPDPWDDEYEWYEWSAL